jgi:hypothetical protein
MPMHMRTTSEPDRASHESARDGVGGGAIERWAVRRFGKDLDRITVTELREELTRLGGLRFRERSSGKPLGGRVAPHLRHVEEGEALRLLQRADEFLRDAPSRPQPRVSLLRGRRVRDERRPRRLHPEARRYMATWGIRLLVC